MTISENVARPWHRAGRWVQCGITGMSFPPEPMTVTFRSHTLYLVPGTPKKNGDPFGDLYPVVAFEHSGMSFEDGQRVISAFINGVAWVRRSGIRTAQFGGGSRVHGLGGQDARASVDDRFELNYVPEPADEKARLALAFYREGLTLNSVAYQCLSFFKILNILLPDSKTQKAWIDANIADARKREAFRTQDWEKNAGFDPANDTAGNYLYVSNRCAIAHAHADPLIDPDDPGDRQRLANDLPMVRTLAEHFIEKEFAVKSEATMWREHLYELQGFADLFGAELVARIKAGEEVPLADLPAMPKLSISLALMPRFRSFEDMEVQIVDCHSCTVNLLLTSPMGHASALLVLDFAAERLDFEIFQHLAVEDDGTLAGAQAELDRLQFIDRYLGNGKLEMWAGGIRMSRRDAFLTLNIDIGITHQNYMAMIGAAQARLETRLSGIHP